MSFQSRPEASAVASPALGGVSTPAPTGRRVALARVGGWLAHGLFRVSVFVGVVVLPLSFLVLIGRLLLGPA